MPDAVERCFERICEASKKLGSLAEELGPDIRWHQIRGLGNFLRHEYDSIDLAVLWTVIQRDLPPLKAVAASALAVLDRRDSTASP